jgi:hypothetical protein
LLRKTGVIVDGAIVSFRAGAANDPSMQAATKTFGDNWHAEDMGAEEERAAAGVLGLDVSQMNILPS